MMQGLLKKQRIEHRRFTPRPISFSSKTLIHRVIYKKRTPLVLSTPSMAPTFSDLERPSLIGLLIALSLFGASCFFVVQNLRGFSQVSLPSLALFYASLDQGMEKTTHREIQQHLTQYVSPPPVSQSLETDEGSL
ncbi:MAG: hypothetical protein N2509_01545, partial [Treponemataceae bacterium]|nr:hypothetical protein [Treponemataceae bacterium]